MAPVGYVVGAYDKPEMAREVAEGRRPKAEYQRFLERNACEVLDYAAVDRSRRPIAALLARRGARNLALPDVALARASACSALLATGEDVGLPLAAFSMVRWPRRPIHMVVHGSYLRSDRFRQIMAVLRRMRHVHYLTLSDSLRHVLIQEFGAQPENVHNASYGVDTEFFRPRPLPARRRALVVSAGMANRDYRTLVTAAETLNADVQIAADSAWFPCALDIEPDALPVNIKAESSGDYQGLRELYSRASFVVVPLYPARHACGYAVIAEAMAMGKAVIVTRTENTSDFVVEGETGFYVEPGDVHGLRDMMNGLITDPGRARAMGEAARARMEQHYSLDAYCARMEQALGITPHAGMPTATDATTRTHEESDEEGRVCHPTH